MKIICPECKKAYQVPDAKIPAKGAYARCPNCRHRFFLKKDAERPKPRRTQSSEKVSGTGQRKNRGNKQTLKGQRSKNPAGAQSACPNCGHRQPPAKECAQCGIIFDKFKMLIACPSCNHQQPRTNVCINCGYEIYKPPQQIKSFKTLISNLREYGISSTGRKALTDYCAENLQKTIVTTAIIVGVILFIFIFSGRFLLAPLFTADKENPFYPVGTQVKGHEFRYSTVEHWNGSPDALVLKMERGTGFVEQRDGLVKNNVLALYTHVLAPGTPEWADGMLAAAARYRAATLIINTDL